MTPFAATSTAWGICGQAEDTCSNWTDDDCDGTVDEGCSACGGGTALVAAPFPFKSQDELRREPVIGGAPPDGQKYGEFSDHRWRLTLSNRTWQCYFRFLSFQTEPSYDILSMGSQAFSGTLAPATYSGTVFNTAAGSAMRFTSDWGYVYAGFEIDQALCYCANGSTIDSHPISLNEGIDGLMLFEKDNAYYEVSLPANRSAFVVVEQMPANGQVQDFDVFVGAGATFPWNCSTSVECGYSPGSSGGEGFEVLPAATARNLKINIHAYTGSGRFRVFVGSPLVEEVEKRGGARIDLGFNESVTNGDADDTRGKEIWGYARAHMMAATDGQYSMGRQIRVTDEVVIDSSYDVVYSDNAYLDGCAPATAYYYGTPFAHIMFPHPVWKGNTFLDEEGNVCPDSGTTLQRVGEILVHEWGHHQFELWDERTSGPADGTTYQCRHTLMAASAGASYVTGWRDLNFCSDFAHGLDPSPSQPGAWWDSNWTDFHQEYIKLTAPALAGALVSPDVSQLRPLHAKMRGLTSETGPW